MATYSVRSKRGPVYTVTNEVDSHGYWSCDCPGWTFKRLGQPRCCKHIKAMRVGEIYFHAAFDVIDVIDTRPPVEVPRSASKPATQPGTRLGRRAALDLEGA